VSYKLGRKPARRLLSTPSLGDFLDKATTWPAVAAQGWEFAVPANALNILGNADYGDCAEAGALHLIQAQQYNVGETLVPTEQDALNLYSAVTGFNPSDPNTDQGTALIDLLNYWKTTGITVGSKVHKIVGYASLDITSVAQMRYAAYTFGGTYLGINCPNECQQNTGNWNFAPGLAIEGGHCIIQAGEGAAGGKIGSWGMWIPATWEFLLGYVEEAYVVVSRDWLDAQQKSPTGLDLNGLLAAMAAI
jgi:hypothetical protein